MVVKTMVKLVAMLNAAPGLRKRVTCKKVPITWRGAAVKFSTAQFLVRKSIAQMRKAIEKRR